MIGPCLLYTSHAEVKLYDGTGEAAYIWVEQGNYIPVIITESGINYTILDRNLGALYSAYNRDAWKAGSEISNRERVAPVSYTHLIGYYPETKKSRKQHTILDK